MQGQGSAVKDWRALPGGCHSIFGENAGAGQCSKKLASGTAGGLPSYLWQNAGARQCSKKIWRALPLGGYPSIFGKNAGAGQIIHELGPEGVRKSRMHFHTSLTGFLASLQRLMDAECFRELCVGERWGAQSQPSNQVGAETCKRSKSSEFFLGAHRLLTVIVVLGCCGAPRN